MAFHSTTSSEREMDEMEDDFVILDDEASAAWVSLLLFCPWQL